MLVVGGTHTFLAQMSWTTTVAEIRGRVFFCHRRRLCTQALHKHTVTHPPTPSSTPTSLLFPGSLQLAPGVLSATLALGVVTSGCERPQRWRQKWRKTPHNDPTVYIEHTRSHSLSLAHTHTRAHRHSGVLCCFCLAPGGNAAKHLLSQVSKTAPH